MHNENEYNPKNDLFNDMSTLPKEVFDILVEDDGYETDYARCKSMEEMIRPYGYTFDWYLDGQPFNLRKI